MTRIPLAIAALIATGAACATALDSAPNDDPLHCDIHITESQGMTTIQARATAPAAVSGQYVLDIHQRSGGGSARIRQSGDFALAPGRSETLGEATLGGTRSQFEAELTLSSGTLSRRCRSVGL